MRLNTLIPNPRFTPDLMFPQAFPSSPFPMTDHSSSASIDHLGHPPCTLEQLCLDTTSLRNILQSPPQSFQHEQSRESLSRSTPIPPIMANQSESTSLWNKSKRAFGSRSFTFLQHQPKGTEGESNVPSLDRAPWRSPTTFQILCMDVSFFGRPLESLA